MIKYLITAVLSLSCQFLSANPLLTIHQELDTSGAREILPFIIDKQHYLGIAQLAKDIPNTPAQMDGGNSDVDVIIMKEEQGKFVPYQRIPSHGNEGLNFFHLDGKPFLIVASIRTGAKAPYNLHAYSILYQWDGKYFYPVQQFAGMATKEWYFFRLGKRAFLAQANGVVNPKLPANTNTDSQIFEWNGTQFAPFQTIPSKWGYGWIFFTLDNQHYLAFADHIGHSTLYKWNSHQFAPFQEFNVDGGRAFDFFTIGKQHFLAFANIKHDSQIYRWDGKQFTLFQTLAGKGGRSFAFFRNHNHYYLLLVKHILGSRDKPTTALQSPLYKWNGQQFEVIQTLPSFGAVKAHYFVMNDHSFLTLANSLSAEVRFLVHSVIYSISWSNDAPF